MRLTWAPGLAGLGVDRGEEDEEVRLLAGGVRGLCEDGLRVLRAVWEEQGHRSGGV